MKQALFLRYGLRWQTKRPPLRPLLEMLLVVLSLMLSALYFDQTSYVSAAEQMVAEAKQSEQGILDCLNGKPLGMYDNGKKKGYGKTVIYCQVFEVPI